MTELFRSACRAIDNVLPHQKNNSFSTAGYPAAASPAATSSLPSSRPPMDSPSAAMEADEVAGPPSTTPSEIGDDTSCRSLKVDRKSSTPYSDATQCKKKSNGRITRPMNAFMVWAQGERRSILQHDSNLHNATISKLLGARWRQLTRDQQQPYHDEAARLADLHRQQYPDYKYRPRKKKTPSTSSSSATPTSDDAREPTSCRPNRLGSTSSAASDSSFCSGVTSSSDPFGHDPTPSSTRRPRGRPTNSSSSQVRRSKYLAVADAGDERKSSLAISTAAAQSRRAAGRGTSTSDATSGPRRRHPSFNHVGPMIPSPVSGQLASAAGCWSPASPESATETDPSSSFSVEGSSLLPTYAEVMLSTPAKTTSGTAAAALTEETNNNKTYWPSQQSCVSWETADDDEFTQVDGDGSSRYIDDGPLRREIMTSSFGGSGDATSSTCTATATTSSTRGDADVDGPLDLNECLDAGGLHFDVEHLPADWTSWWIGSDIVPTQTSLVPPPAAQPPHPVTSTTTIDVAGDFQFHDDAAAAIVVESGSFYPPADVVAVSPTTSTGELVCFDLCRTVVVPVVDDLHAAAVAAGTKSSGYYWTTVDFSQFFDPSSDPIFDESAA